ncbi:type II secretion system F family protein [Allobranchiibius huperziae]|uniref:Tight adherence protein B n=1 Tax=Allobranchiibius huperziae TaxID=1874116 RepID=A0A853DBI3_9MICO|nr:type II secretion system F family protein [Allobranchiibius huperziae]NYJ74298.1 tight adherence protein B [Allobranchiibius huperziae]
MNSPLASGAAAAGVGACTLALLVGLYVMLAPGPVRLPRERRRPGTDAGPSALTSATAAATSFIDNLLRRHGGGRSAAAALERAGLRVGVQDFILMVCAAALASAALGLLLLGPLLGIGLALVVALMAKLWLGRLAARRQGKFADQLEDSLQLLASGLRAGHSLLQALDSVSREADEPTAGEFSRIINETRMGRDLSLALDETGKRLQSEDFVWVTQAIAINREVGGNLAEVLDGVGRTIRERNQIRRQVKALSAEGKLSAYVLIALPFGIVAFLAVSNPAYIAKFTQSAIGYALLGVAGLLLVVGTLWLRKVVSFKF